MLRVFSRPLMVLNTTVSPSRLTKITDDSRAPVGVRSSDHGYVRPVEHLAGDVIER